jgi:hypothetical protein
VLSLRGILPGGAKWRSAMLVRACLRPRQSVYLLVRSRTWAAGTARRDMVRRRSTVRFRNGAPGHGQFSNGSNERRGTSPGDALQLPLHSDSSHCTARARRQLLKAAAGGPSRDSLVTVRARSRWAGRLAAGRFQASMSRLKIQSPPGDCRCRPVRQARVTSAWITAASLGWAGDERGQDADSPVQAVRVRDILQLGGRHQARAAAAAAKLSTRFVLTSRPGCCSRRHVSGDSPPGDRFPNLHVTPSLPCKTSWQAWTAR